MGYVRDMYGISMGNICNKSGLVINIHHSLPESFARTGEANIIQNLVVILPK
jgi:hypothetical protein